MSEGSIVERDITFTLRLGSAAENRQIADSFKTMISSAERESLQLGKSTGRSISESFRKSRQSVAEFSRGADAEFGKFLSSAEKRAADFRHLLQTNAQEALRRSKSEFEAVTSELSSITQAGASGTLSNKQAGKLPELRLREAEATAKVREAQREVNEQLKEAERIREQQQKALDGRIRREIMLQRRQREAHAKAAKDRERAAEQAARAEEQRARQAQTALRKEQAAREKVITQGRVALDGVLELTRGLAVLGITTEDDLAKFARLYAEIDAGFRIFKGGIDVVLGVTRAMRAYRAATLQAAAAQQLLAVGAGGAASGVSRGAATGIAAGAAGGLATGGAAAGGAFSGVGAFATGIALPAFAAAELINFGRSGSTITQETIGLFHARRRAEAAGEFGNQLQSRLERRRAEQSRAEQQTRESARVSANIRQQREQLFQRADSAAGLSDIQQLQAQRVRAIRERELAEAGIGRADSINQSRVERGLFDNPAEREAAEQRFQQSRQRVADIESSIVDQLKRQQQERQRGVELSQREFDQAARQLEVERDRNDQIAARFGRLDKGQQRALLRVSKKAANNEQLSQSELQFLDRSGFGQNFVTGQFAARGTAAGADQVLSAFGDLDRQRAAANRARRGG